MTEFTVMLIYLRVCVYIYIYIYRPVENSVWFVYEYDGKKN